MQQVAHLFQLFHGPMIILTLGFIGIVLLSKMNIFFKIPSILCAIYVFMIVFYPKALEEYLGGGMQTVALICFIFAALALVVSSLRFFKASLNIFCWLAIAAIAGSVAFPDYAKITLNKNEALKNYINPEKLASVVSNIKTGFLSKSLE
jgi:hypothetical protein